jgi:hypothetical protein
MEILYPRCAGLDVHKESVSACVLTPGAQAEPDRRGACFSASPA